MHLPSPLEGWQWIEGRFLISHAAWSWARILAHGLGGDRPAIEALPSLFDEFVADRDRLGPDGLDARRTALLVERYGRDWHEPPPA